jgi:hypothetical protein
MMSLNFHADAFTFFGMPPRVSNLRTAFVLILAIAFATLVDISDIAVAVMGAAAFLSFRMSAGKPAPKSMPKKCAPLETTPLDNDPVHPRKRQRARMDPQTHAVAVKPTSGREPLPQPQHPRLAPVPTFGSADWDGQISELLQKSMPTTETAALVFALSRKVQTALGKSFPEVRVSGYAQCNPCQNKAFATAIPDIEMVASVEQHDLVKRLGSKYANVDQRCLHKIAIRSCTDVLSSSADFRFRRSAFKGSEPKVTLVALTSADSMAFDFSVNADTPERHDILLKGCAAIDRRARELVILVQRWARDRGISHAAQGYLTPYAWSLATISFLQVRNDMEGALLPPFTVDNGFDTRRNGALAEEDTSVGTLFKEFVQFYNGFRWHTEAICIRTPSRSSPKAAVPWRKQSTPFIEDPFDPTVNHGSGLTNENVSRMCEELARAHGICSNHGALAQLLELWQPPDAVANGERSSRSDISVLKVNQPAKASVRGSLTACPIGDSLRPGSAQTRTGKAAKEETSTIHRSAGSDSDSTRLESSPGSETD